MALPRFFYRQLHTAAIAPSTLTDFPCRLHTCVDDGPRLPRVDVLIEHDGPVEHVGLHTTTATITTTTTTMFGTFIATDDTIGCAARIYCDSVAIGGGKPDHMGVLRKTSEMEARGELWFPADTLCDQIDYNYTISPTELWETSAVETMAGLFEMQHDCNPTVAGWQTSSVTDMSRMFAQAFLFNGTGVESWQTSLVVDMSYMFFVDTAFDQNISSW